MKIRKSQIYTPRTANLIKLMTEESQSPAAGGSSKSRKYIKQATWLHSRIHPCQGGEYERWAVNLGLIKYFTSPPFLITITRRPWPTEGLATVAPTLFHLVTSTFPHTVCNTCATRATPSRLADTGEGESGNSSTDGWTIGSKRWPWRDEALNFFLLSLSLSFSLSPLSFWSY